MACNLCLLCRYYQYVQYFLCSQKIFSFLSIYRVCHNNRQHKPPNNNSFIKSVPRIVAPINPICTIDREHNSRPNVRRIRMKDRVESKHLNYNKFHMISSIFFYTNRSKLSTTKNDN